MPSRQIIRDSITTILTPTQNDSRDLPSTTTEVTTVLSPTENSGHGSSTTEIDSVLVGYVTGSYSKSVFFETLFDSFNLNCKPVYKKYTDDESKNEPENSLSLELSDYPRYIEITWNTCPAIEYALQEQAQQTFDTSGIFTVPQINDFMNPGAGSMKLTTQSKNKNLPEEFDESKVLSSNKMVGIKVSDIISNLKIADRTGIIIDDLETRAKVPQTQQNSFESFLDKRSNELEQTNIVITPKAALELLSAPSFPNDSREHVESSLVVSAFSTEIGLADSLEDQIDQTTVDPPYIETSAIMPSFSYAGYLIQRQKLSRDGIFVDDKVFKIVGRNSNVYRDVSVAYGTVYRYRISSIAKWVHNQELRLDGFVDVEQTTQNGQMVIRTVRSSWSPYVNAVVLDTDLPTPPKELSIIIDKKRKGAILFWKVPDNQQSDIIFFNLYRRKVSEFGHFSEWEQISRNIKPSNGSFFNKLEENDSGKVIYAMTSVSIHGQESSLSEQISCQSSLISRDTNINLESFPGVSIENHGALSVNPPLKSLEKVEFSNRFSLKPRTGTTKTVGSDRSVIVRIMSTQTGENIDIPVNLLYKNSTVSLPAFIKRVQADRRNLQVQFPQDNISQLVQSPTAQTTTATADNTIIFPDTMSSFLLSTGKTVDALWIGNEATASLTDRTGNGNNLAPVGSPVYQFLGPGNHYGVKYEAANNLAHRADVGLIASGSFIYGAVISIASDIDYLQTLVGRSATAFDPCCIAYLFTYISPRWPVLLIRDAAAGQLIVAMNTAIDWMNLYPGEWLVQVQVDRETVPPVARMRVSSNNSLIDEKSGSMTGIGSLSGSTGAFGFGASLGNNTVGGSAFYYGYYMTGSQCCGQNVLSSIASSLGYE